MCRLAESTANHCFGNDNIRPMKRDNTIPKLMIDDDAPAADFVDSLTSEACFALDTEFMRVKTYHPDLCLVQLARPDGCLGCIDPLAVDRIMLGERLAAVGGVVIIHSAGQDLEVLGHAMGYVPETLFDTQLGAAFAGLGEQVSYAALAREILGVEVDKGETRTDWRRRPLTDAQVEYAFEDVAYLIEIYNDLNARLEAAGKLEWMRKACADLVSQSLTPSDDGVVARFKAGSSLAPDDQPLLRDLVLWREDKARAIDRPREWVVAGGDLVEIARRRPTSRDQLQSCTALNAAQVRRYADDVIERVQRHAQSAPERIWHGRTDLSADQRAQVKLLQRRVRAVCDDLSISAAAIVSRADIEALVLGRPGRLDSGWRRDLFAEAVGEYVESR